MSSAAKSLPPDQEERRAILEELDSTMLVEAAAGTGKTTSMVGRMTALLEQGKCRIQNLAAVTFTRKAASELRSRFQEELERGSRDPSSPAASRERLDEAIAHIESCFIGTIHSFCGRLLRERPVEAGVDVAFQEVDENDDRTIREEAWDSFVAEAIASGDTRLERLEKLGLHIAGLGDSFLLYAGYPDVKQWPAPDVDPPDCSSPAAAVKEYSGRMRKITSSLADRDDLDQLLKEYDLIPRMIHQVDMNDPAELFEVMERFRSRKIVQKKWPGGDKKAKGEAAKGEQAFWDEFRETVAEPFKMSMYAARYAAVLPVLQAAGAAYDNERQRRGVLNYQDLLIKAAAMLRENRSVRADFQERFSYLLVDEFQDTDPIQAEVMLLLTSDDPAEQDWRQCRPRPGSLFVVGDPKQSIYRFRRADIVTYNVVKKIIGRSGGQVRTLSASFRMAGPLVDWVNDTFGSRFPQSADEFSPAYVRLMKGRQDAASTGPASVQKIVVPAKWKSNDPVVEWESDLIARMIRHIVDEGVAIPRSTRDLENGVAPEARFDDFLVVTRGKGRLERYGEALQRYGIPHRVTGGGGLSGVDEISLLHLCLRAVVRPDDPVALVALLRSTLFGFSDSELFALADAGGTFRYRRLPPDQLDEPVAGRYRCAFVKLQEFSRWLLRYPPVTAAEKIAAELGILSRAAAAPGGNGRAGSLARALEIVRSKQEDGWTAASMVDQLGRIVEGSESYDALPARPSPGHDEVRVMNLHKVKGLEAPVVFLADPAGNSAHPVAIHVDRSHKEVRGYLAVCESSTHFPGTRKLLACPLDWEEREAEERRFLEAEEKRLLYVAATRGGGRLVVVQRTNFVNRNPWQILQADLEDAAVADDPGGVTAPSRTKVKATLADVDEAVKELAERMEGWCRESYSSDPVTGEAEPGALDRAASSSRGRGARWGTLIHRLLEAAGSCSEMGLWKLAESFIEELDVPLPDPDDPTEREDQVKQLAEEAAALVQGVINSKIWDRAGKSEIRLIEVPVNVPQGTGSLLKGTIDLVFREPDGWVIVDYKTEGQAGDDLDPLVEKYRGQLEKYGSAWSAATSDPVKETGLYFVSADRYKIVGSD